MAVGEKKKPQKARQGLFRNNLQRHHTHKLSPLSY